MKIYYLLAVLLFSSISDKSYASCASLISRKECIRVTVADKLEVEKNFADRYRMQQAPQHVCRRIILSPEFKMEAYLHLEKGQMCPDSGTIIFGNLNIPCNDTGTNVPVSFSILSPSYCLKRIESQNASQVDISILHAEPEVEKSTLADIANVFGDSFLESTSPCLTMLFQKETLDLGIKQQLVGRIHLQATDEWWLKGVKIEKIEIIANPARLPNDVLQCFTNNSLSSFQLSNHPKKFVVDIKFRFGGRTDNLFPPLNKHHYSFHINKECGVQHKPYHWNVAFCKYASKSSDFFAKSVQKCLLNKKVEVGNENACDMNRRWKNLICKLLKTQEHTDYKKVCVENMLPASVERGGIDG